MYFILDYINNNEVLIEVLLTLIALVIISLIVKLINRILYKSIIDKRKYYVVRKRVYYSFSSLYIVFLIFLWSNSTASLVTYFGLVSAGIAIALKDIFANIGAWLFITIRKPFQVSDRVGINSQTGDVLDIRLFQFTLMEVESLENGEQSTGKIINVPNYYIFLYTLKNYDKGFQYIWNEIKVLITFESNWEKAKLILTDIVNRYSVHLSDEAFKMVNKAKRHYMIHYDKLTPIVYLDVKESGIQLSLRYLCVVRQRRNTINDLWEEILHVFKNEADIQLAYPTFRINNLNNY